jgi:hypothetical protein
MMHNNSMSGVELFDMLTSLPLLERLAFAAKLHERVPTSKLRWLHYLTDGEYATESWEDAERLDSAIEELVVERSYYDRLLDEQEAAVEKLSEARRNHSELTERLNLLMVEAQALRPSHSKLQAILKERRKPKRGSKERMQEIHRLKLGGQPWREIHRQVGDYEDPETMCQAYCKAKLRHPAWFKRTRQVTGRVSPPSPRAST